MKPSRVFALASLSAIVFIAACLPGARAPQITPTRSLELGGEGGGGASTKAFGVVFASPKGATIDPSEVTIVFNRSMRPLDLAEQEAPSPANIVVKGTSTVPRGAWRWMGTSAIIFAPEPRLPRATEYAVTVPAGTKALDGSVLPTQYTFAFATSRPHVARVEPSDGEQHLVPTATFDVRFDQPVDAREIERAVRVVVGEAKGTKAAPFKASWPQSDNKMLVRITPLAPLPLDTPVALEFDPSLHGIEGPLPIGKAEPIHYRTYGPLVVKNIDCSRETQQSRCIPGASARVELSNRAPMKDVLAHVRVEPKIKLDWGAPPGDDDKRAHISIPARMRPARSYRILVTAGLKDEYGQVLARDASFTLETDDLAPAAEIGLEGEIFEPSKGGKKREIPITSVNLDSYELVTAALDEKALAEFVLADASRERPSQKFDRARHVAGGRYAEVKSNASKNVDYVRSFGVDELVGTKGRGAALLGIRYVDKRGRVDADTRVVSVTDLAITGKMSRFGSLVWVSRLSDGKPVSGATVAVVGKDGERFATKTDANGLATIPNEKYDPVTASGNVDDKSILVARTDGDWSYRRVSEMLSPWRYGASNDPSGRMQPLGMLFTERGIYRPGETVRAKLIFRKPTPRGTETPVGREVAIEAFDGNGDKFFTTKTKLDAFGEAAIDVALPATARLGTGEIRGELVDGNKKEEGPDRAATASFQLAAYKAAEFKVAVEPDHPSYIRGDKATFAVRGDYLFGAPMSGGTVRYTATRGSGSFTPPGAEAMVVDDDAFSFDLPDTNERASRFQQGNGALDPKGSFAASLALALPHQRGTEVVSFEAEIEDVARQTIASRASVIVHPGEFYVAMKPPKDLFSAKGTVLEPEILMIEPSGKVRAGVPVKIELVRRTWHSVVEASGEYGRHYESKPVDKTLAVCDFKTGATPSSCKLTLPDVGYFLLHATSKDPRGNTISSSASIYGIGAGESAGWAMSDSTHVDLVTDKKSYEIGDTARILVKSPFRDAEALVTVERAGIYRQERVSLAGATPTISVPITDEMRPNAFVAVHLVRGRTKAQPAKGQDIGAPAFALGYAELKINPEARRLKIAVLPTKKELRPGEMVDVDLAVTDRAGKGTKSEVTFFAVDEGVLMLTGYRTPDPLPIFSSPRSLNVFALESRVDLARVFVTALAGSGVDKGDEGGGGGGMRADFRATAHFEPSIITAADGKTHVRFKLPDNLTTYRLMAVAAGEDDRFGFGDAQIVASRPLMARPALPRFLRAGDAMDAGVVVSSKGMAATQVEVTLAATGATIDGDAKRTLQLPANSSVEVRWAIATPNVGAAKLTFKVSGGGESDTVQVTRDVKVPLSLEAVALYGETTEAAAERIGDLKAMRSDVGQLDVRVASTALVGLADGAEQLIEYPYGCTEQLTSRLVPLVPLRELAKEFKIPLPAKVDVAVDEAIAKILLNQRPDGSFGYWPDSMYGDTWVTAYALWGLEVSRAAGRRVPDDVIDRAVAYLRKQLASPKIDQEIGLVDRAFILDVLAVGGKADPGYSTQLYEKRDKLPIFARALLAHAMAIAKMDRKPIDELLRDIEGHLRVTTAGATVVENLGDKYAVLLDSEARTTAMVLRAIVAIDPKHPLAGRLARGILSMRSGGRWKSTQEAAWSLIALDDYRRTGEKDAPDFDAAVYLGQAQIFKAPFHDRAQLEATTSVPAAKLFEGQGAGGATLAFQVQGKGKLYYEARLRYAKRELPTTGLDRGFYVRKLVRAVSPEALKDALATLPPTSATFVRGGDLVLVDLIVVTPDPREQVVIEDPLPAGLEAVQASLATSTQSLDVAESGGEGDQSDDEVSDDDARATGRAYGRAWFHREIHDDKVLTFVEHMPAGMYHYRYLARATTFGKFVVPPTRAECMYEPSLFGRTGATIFEVRTK